jgi:hypothetical protein
MQTLLKILLAAALALGVGQAKAAKEPVYTLAEALKKNLVKIEIQGADSVLPNSSSHYGKCLQMKLTNLTSSKFTVKLETGQQFEPDDSTIQNMMTTQQQLFVLGPNKHSKKYINAMCVQHHDGGPSKKIKFTMAQMSPKNLLGIAQLVEKHKYFNSTAQNAVWCISDGEDISTIQNDEDTVMAYVLQKYVSEVTGQPMPQRHSQRQTHRETQRSFKTTVVFEWTTNREANTTLAVLDANNNPVMEIVKDQLLPSGNHSYTIVLNSAEIPLGTYTIILYINRVPKMQRRVNLGS